MSKILAFTCTHGDRPFLPGLIPNMRGTAGQWFDWLVVLSGASDEQQAIAEQFLHSEDRNGIQYLINWPENRGQHHATAAALDLARSKGYDWLLRIDDDIQPKTKRWLKKMLDRNRQMHHEKGLLGSDKCILAPKIIGLKNPPQPRGVIEGFDFPAEEMTFTGGGLRLHPVALLEGYEPPLYSPRGRDDPQSLARFLGSYEDSTVPQKGIFVRFPDIRVVHRTAELEEMDTEHAAKVRRTNWYWPWLGRWDCPQPETEEAKS